MAKLLKNASQYFLIYAYYKARPQFINPIYWARKFWDFYGKQMIKSHANDLYQLIKKTTAKSSSTGCGYGDYWSLYSTIRKVKPAKIVECGSGISTVVIAHAVRANGNNASFVSLEQAKFYFDNIIEIFPVELK